MKSLPSTVLEVKNISKYFYASDGFWKKRREVKAVRDVSFRIEEGECFGLVGESGCGKTTLSKTLLHLYEPTSGEILINNENLYNLSPKDRREQYRNIQMVFQDPYWSINPKMRVESIVAEPIKAFEKISNQDLSKRVYELLDQVGLSPTEYAHRYPYQLSGGQRQRVVIARALALKPKILILDEPTSALDVSVQAQILNLLKDLQEKLNLTYLFISHDLSVIQFMCQKVAVMYLGEIVEMGETDAIFSKPVHPYTQKLIKTIPTVDDVAISFDQSLYDELRQKHMSSQDRFYEIDEHHVVNLKRD